MNKIGIKCCAEIEKFPHVATSCKKSFQIGQIHSKSAFSMFNHFETDLEPITDLKINDEFLAVYRILDKIHYTMPWMTIREKKEIKIQKN